MEFAPRKCELQLPDYSVGLMTPVGAANGGQEYLDNYVSDIWVSVLEVALRVSALNGGLSSERGNYIVSF